MFRQSNNRFNSGFRRSGFTPGRPHFARRFSKPARKSQGLDIRMLVKKADFAVTPEEVYQPTHTFNDFAIADILKKNIAYHKYTVPTPIQDQAIPHLLEGHDVVGIANTGTGKTAAFLIPLINKIHQNRNQRALIIAPTRELALQIQQECNAFCWNMRIFSVLCIGGANMNRQIQGLRRGPSIVIGTPGRLKDLYNQGVLRFEGFSSIVLDEVDRMLDMGFIHDIRFIIDKLPQQRQSLFFSATLTREVQGVMGSFLKDPVTISVKKQETAQNVDQDIVRTNGRVKFDVLHEMLSSEGFDKVLVFGKTKWGVERLAKQLSQRGHAVAALHGNKSQSQRQRALDEFKQQRVRVLLATDVASRGLDIADVTHVINYDLPETYEDYVHRIGRTGRANKKGVALSFVD